MNVAFGKLDQSQVSKSWSMLNSSTGNPDTSKLTELTALSKVACKLERYSHSLQNLVLDFDPRNPQISFEGEVTAALNGAAERVVQLAYPISVRRAQGIYPTGFYRSAILARLLIPTKRSFKKTSILLDPACGTGDLLLAAAMRIAIGQNVSDTLESWGQQIIGVDIDPKLVDIARLRLVLLALHRHNKKYPSNRDFQNEFKNISVGNALKIEYPQTATHVIMNPPYHRETAQAWYPFSTGKVTCAAQFLYQMVIQPWSGCNLVALLPDVIRSGSSYERLRQFVANNASVEDITLNGKFSKDADIDVFTMKAKLAGTEQSACFPPTWSNSHNAVVEDDFLVHVGSVVPHRLAKNAPTALYLDVAGLPRSMTGEIKVSSVSRIHGKPFKPPFVVIRRTSSPGDRLRNAAYIVRGKQPVAVENHLIVVLPRDGKLASCRSLTKVIIREDTCEWIDTRIKCRHLTVSSVQEIPLS